MSYPDGTQAFGYDRWNRRVVRRSRERYRWMDSPGLECCLGERWFGTHSRVDPFDLSWVDVVPAFHCEENSFVGRCPDWLNQQRAIEEFHDVRYPPDVRIRVLHRRYRCPCDLWFVLISLPGYAITDTPNRCVRCWAHRPTTRQSRYHDDRET